MLPNWKGKDVIVIGGGSSLKNFPWPMLVPELTIGCNAAFKLGPEVCKIVFFGDYKSFWLVFEKELKTYPGLIYTHARKLQDQTIPGVTVLKRMQDGLHTDGIGWNGNTGAGALNLALLTGASRVFLLGFDMRSQKQESHWHGYYNQKDERGHRRPDCYPRFLQGFDNVIRDWKEKFSDREIINVNDNSELRGFPMMGVQEFIEERSHLCNASSLS